MLLVIFTFPTVFQQKLSGCSFFRIKKEIISLSHNVTETQPAASEIPHGKQKKPRMSRSFPCIRNRVKMPTTNSHMCLLEVYCKVVVCSFFSVSLTRQKSDV